MTGQKRMGIGIRGERFDAIDYNRLLESVRFQMTI